MPVQFVLLLFGFANAGVPFAQIGPGTYYVLAGLLSWQAARHPAVFRVARLAGRAASALDLRIGDLLHLGIVASIGFTVSLFFATAAFSKGERWQKPKWALF